MPEAPPMPPMLAYTIKGSLIQYEYPTVVIGQGSGQVAFFPNNPPNDIYWFYFLDASNPKVKVYDVVVPGSANTNVPSGLDTYLNNPGLLFGVVTYGLSTLHVPQGALYKFLATYGAGRELQKLEQLNVTLSCGSYGGVSYILTGQGGPRGGSVPPPSYEAGSFNNAVVIEMSLMPQMNGQPPYSLCDSYTF
jgi:hypothetical protein